jgi:ureidoglycolate hydrolase
LTLARTFVAGFRSGRRDQREIARGIDMGINYRADTWRHPLSALERTGRFAILTFVDGTSADEQFVDLPQEVVIEA